MPPEAPRRGPRSPAPSLPRCEDVVVDHDARPTADRVGCDLERVLSVFERVRRGDGLGRQLSPGAARRQSLQPAAMAMAPPSQKPRASAPRTRSAPRSRVQVASSSTACASASRSRSSGEMSLKPTPGSGKSGTSRTFVLRSITGDLPNVAPEEEVGRLLGALREPLQIGERLATPVGVPGTERRPDHRLEQPRDSRSADVRKDLSVPGRADPELPQRLARRRDVDVALGVGAATARDSRPRSARKSSSSFTRPRVTPARAQRPSRSSASSPS